MQDAGYGGGTLRRARLGIALSLAALGCTPDTLADRAIEGPGPASLITAPVSCGTGPGDPGNSYFAVQRWNCGDTLVFSNLPAGLSGILSDWTLKLGATSGSIRALALLESSQLPSPGTAPHRRPINVIFTADGSYCGEFGLAGNGGFIDLTKSGNCGTLQGVFANELAGLVGYTDGSDGLDQESPFDGHCTRTIVANGQVNHSVVCAHEAEGILAVYGIRVDPSLGMVQKHILTSYELSTGNLSLLPGDTRQASVASLGFEAHNPSMDCGQALRSTAATGAGAALIPPVCDTVFPAELSWSWGSSNSSVVSVSGSGLTRTLTANAPGSATITVNIDDPGPVAVGTFINGSGTPRTFTVTVLAPALTRDAGNGQTGLAGAQLAQPLVARVTANGAPVVGTTVTFAVTSGGGAVSTASATTDATGRASTSWTLGPSAGTQLATASKPGTTGSPVTYTATATLFGAPINFRRTDCYRDVGGTPVEITHFLGWTNAAGSTGWQLVIKTTNDTLSNMTPYATGGTTQTFTYGPFLYTGKGPIEYLFLRNQAGLLSSRWVPMTPASIKTRGDSTCRLVQ